MCPKDRIHTHWKAGRETLNLARRKHDLQGVLPCAEPGDFWLVTPRYKHERGAGPLAQHYVELGVRVSTHVCDIPARPPLSLAPVSPSCAKSVSTPPALVSLQQAYLNLLLKLFHFVQNWILIKISCESDPRRYVPGCSSICPQP